MPRGDATGPWGMGPMTGRAAGPCAGYGIPGYMNPGLGKGGPGMGHGGGRGHRNRYWATGLMGWQRAAMGPMAPYQPTREQELADLRAQVKLMQESLAGAQERIQGLEKESEQQ
jgi:hypothetical protein